MGGEVTGRTRRALLEGLTAGVSRTLDESLEREKESNDFLAGVPAIAKALGKDRGEVERYLGSKNPIEQ